nr:hypothetical protein [Tanacetum cinerariifolium]
NHDSSIIPSSLKIDYFLDEFVGKLTLLKSIPLRIDKTDCHPENEIRLIERLLYENSSPRPPEEFISDNSNVDIESFFPSPIPNEDSDSRMEEIDLSFNPDDLVPLSIEDDDNDSERDILILEKLPRNYSLSLPVNESFHFYIPLFSRPPAKPPDGNTGNLNIKMMGDISDQKYGGNWVKLSDLKQALRGRHPMLIYPLIDHHCCYECGNSLNDFFCPHCTCEFCVNDAHVGYNCPAQVPSFQTLSSFPQQYPRCEDCRVLTEANHYQTPQYTVNHPIFNVHNDFLHSQNELTIAQNKLIEQMTQLTSICEMACLIVQKKLKEKRIEEDQADKAQNSKILACCDADDDYNSAIIPNEPVDSLSIGDEHLNIIPAMESDEFIKSYVKNLVPNPSESEGENGCALFACFTTFSNILFDAEYKFDSADDQSLSDEDFPEEIFSNPLFEEEIISTKIDPHHFDAESNLIKSMLNHDSSIIPSSLKIDSFLDEFVGELTLLKSIPLRIDKTDCHPENEIRLIERLLYDNLSPHPSEEFVSENSNAEIKSFSPSLIPDEDSNSELLDNHSLSLPVTESFHFDIPSFSRPPVRFT